MSHQWEAMYKSFFFMGDNEMVIPFVLTVYADEVPVRDDKWG